MFTRSQLRKSIPHLDDNIVSLPIFYIYIYNVS